MLGLSSRIGEQMSPYPLFGPNSNCRQKSSNRPTEFVCLKMTTKLSSLADLVVEAQSLRKYSTNSVWFNVKFTFSKKYKFRLHKCAEFQIRRRHKRRLELVGVWNCKSQSSQRVGEESGSCDYFRKLTFSLFISNLYKLTTRSDFV